MLDYTVVLKNVVGRVSSYENFISNQAKLIEFKQ